MDTRGYRTGIVALLGILLTISPSEAKQPKIQQFCVDPSNSACQPSIQAAIDLASGVAAIAVAPGTFVENIRINDGSRPKKLTLTITGAGPGLTIVDGNNSGHVFKVGPATTLTLSGLTIEKGNAGTGNGGGIDSTSDSSIMVINSEVEDNAAGKGGGIYLGGGSLTLTDSTVGGNSALNDAPGGIGNTGGGLFDDIHVKQVTIINSTISGNSAATGGGMSALGGRVTIRQSSIIGNGALPQRPSPTVFFPAFGGGLYVANSTMAISDSTISGNVAQSSTAFPFTSEGGGILIIGARLTVNSVTISDNAADRGGGVKIVTTAKTGKIRTQDGKLTISNSIIARNNNDCEATLISAGFNLIGDNTCDMVGKTGTDVSGEDPLLQPLALNPPGSTETQALANGSPALKAGNPDKPDGKGNHCLPTDQRGVKRPTGACDIGAFQLSQ